MDVRLNLFGKAQVLVDGHATALAPDRRCQLLALLALRRDWVSRDEAAALMWPERGNVEARNNLRKVLHDAAALPWAAGAQLQGTALRWAVESDVAEFQRLLAAGHIEAALDIGHAPLLEGFETSAGVFGDWLTQQRLVLAERRRAAALLAIGDPAASRAQRLAIAQRLLALDPLDEDALAAELQALLADGQDAAARHAYKTYAERLAEAVGAEPAARLRALLIAPAAGAAGLPPSASASPVAFIGRAAELAQLRSSMLTVESRLLTVQGPGGIGKSRLAKAALASLEPHFAQGALRVPLDDLQSVEAVAPRLAQLAQLHLSSAADARDQVAAWLAPREMLVLLDNAEHLPELPALMAAWAAAAPRVRWLVTSRQRLGLPGERVMPLGGLGLPADDTPAALVASDAGQLFVHRAHQAKPNFDPLRAAGDAARLLRSIGGMPLAIELAAAWVRLLPLHELADEVGSSLQVLQQAEEGDERPEHRSMQATFEQSWRLLVPAEQRVLAALALFVGEFSRAAALAVTGAGVALLSALADKSLLQVQVDDDALAARLSLHPVLRQFVRGKLAQTVGERRDLATRHARYYGQWLAQVEPALRGPDQASALAQIEMQLSDCHAAWRRAVARCDTEFVERATLALMYYHEARGRRNEGIALFVEAEAAFERSAAADGALAMLARALSTLRYRNGDTALTIDTATRGIARARRAGARTALKGCLLNLGLAQWQSGTVPPARACFEEGLALAQADRDLAGIGAFLSSLAAVHQLLGDVAAAEAHFRQALQVNRELNSPRAVTTTLYNLGLLLLEHGRSGDALPHFEEGLRLCADNGIGVMRGNFLFGLGGARLALGQLPVARELTRQAWTAALDNGEPYLAAEIQMQLARIALAAGDAPSAREHARLAVRQAQPLDNPTVLLNAICSVAEAAAQSGALHDAVALWLFVAQHPQGDACNRREAQASADGAALIPPDRAHADRQAQGYELASLALTLAQNDQPGPA